MGRDVEPSSIGMDKLEIRHMLVIAGDHPLRVAVAVAGDGRAVIVLDRRKQPRALERELKQALPNGRQYRFGTFSADPEDRKLARFVLNRPAAGLARRLVKALKGSGLRRVEITHEDGSDDEAAEDIDGEEDVAVFDPVQRRAEAAASERHTALNHALLLVVERIARVAGPDQARRTGLVELAASAQGHLKHGNLDAAAEAIAALTAAVGR